MLDKARLERPPLGWRTCESVVGVTLTLISLIAILLLWTPLQSDRPFDVVFFSIGVATAAASIGLWWLWSKVGRRAERLDRSDMITAISHRLDSVALSDGSVSDFVPGAWILLKSGLSLASDPSHHLFRTLGLPRRQRRSLVIDWVWGFEEGLHLAVIEVPPRGIFRRKKTVLQAIGLDGKEISTMTIASGYEDAARRLAASANAAAMRPPG